MMKFKKTLTEKVGEYKYYILLLVTLAFLCGTVFYFYNQKPKISSVDDDAQFNFIIDGKNYIMPSPVHSFHLLNTMGFSWKNLAEHNSEINYESETRIALNLGLRSADGTVLLFGNEKLKAIEARSTFIKLADKIGIAQDIKDALRELDKSVVLGHDQTILDDRIIDLEYQIEKALHLRKKENLAVLVELGAWLEGLHIVSKGILKNYTPAYAEILRQPHIADVYLEVLVLIISRLENDKDKILLESIAKHLENVSKIASHTHKESFPLEKVKQLNEIAVELKKLIESNGDLPIQ